MYTIEINNFNQIRIKISQKLDYMLSTLRSDNLDLRVKIRVVIVLLLLYNIHSIQENTMFLSKLNFIL